MKLNDKEIENLEISINSAVKQTAALLLIASMVPNNGVIEVKDILYCNKVYADALEIIEKLKESR